MVMYFVQNVCSAFNNNRETAIVAYQASITFQGKLDMRDNSGINGGCFSIYHVSQVDLIQVSNKKKGTMNYSLLSSITILQDEHTHGRCRVGLTCSKLQLSSAQSHY